MMTRFPVRTVKFLLKNKTGLDWIEILLIKWTKMMKDRFHYFSIDASQLR